MPEKRHNGQDVIWFSKNENERNESHFYRSRSFGCYYSIPFVSYQKKRRLAADIVDAPLLLFPLGIWFVFFFFPRTPPPSWTFILRAGILGQIDQTATATCAVWIVSLLSNWRFHRHLHTNVFFVSFFLVVKLVKGSNFVGWLTMSRAFLRAPWSHQSIQVGENRFELLFSQMGENTTHCSCLPEEEGEERRSMSALTFLPTVLGRHSPRDYQQEYYIVEYVDDRIEKLFAPSQSTAGHTFTVKRVESSFP